MFKQLKRLIITAIMLGALGTSVHAAELSSWAVDDFINANKAQLIPFSVGARSMCGYITREQLCELIVNLYEGIMNESLADYPANPFTDCTNKTVINAYGSGLVGGTSEDTFSPNQLVTRQEMAKMLQNMLAATDVSVRFSNADALSQSGYSDIGEVSDWAKQAMATMLDYSLINGVEGMLLPSGNATREQAIVAVSRAYETFKKTDIEMNDVLKLISPKEQESISGESVSVSWNNINRAETYRVLIRNANGELLVNDVVRGTSHSIVKSMFTDGAYNVSVEAMMPNGKTIYSVPVGFFYTVLNDEDSMFHSFEEIPDELFVKNFGISKSELINKTLHPEQETAAVPSTQESATPVSPAPAISDGSKVSAVFVEAEKYLGVPYVYGGTTPSGFDCSGFVQYVFKNNGIKLNRTSRDQYSGNGIPVNKSQLQRGDLVFFGENGVVGHVGIYAGNGMMIHSPSTGKNVMYTSIESNYYQSRYIGAKRVIN